MNKQPFSAKNRLKEVESLYECSSLSKIAADIVNSQQADSPVAGKTSFFIDIYFSLSNIIMQYAWHTKVGLLNHYQLKNCWTNLNYIVPLDTSLIAE